MNKPAIILFGTIGVAVLFIGGIAPCGAGTGALQPGQDAAVYACGPDAPPGTWRCVHISPSGNDANPGTLHAPVATPHRALALVRAFDPKWEGDVAVFFRGGTYHLDRTLTIEPADSGKNGHRLVIQPYSNESVTLSGGSPVGGWAALENGGGLFYTTDLPKTEFRHLVVNGRRAHRARHPNGDDFYAIAAWDKPAVIPTSEGPKEPFGRRLGVRDDDAWFVDSLDPAHLSKVEVVFERYAGSGLLRVDTVGKPDEKGSGIRYIIPKSPERDRLFGPNGGSSWQIDRLALRFENSIAFLDEPGEWFLDTMATPDTPILYYKPPEGETPANGSVLAPRLETLLRFKGTESNRVHDVVVRGLCFTATTWFLPNKEGFVSTYPGVDYRDNSGFWDAYLHPAAIHLEGTERVTLERNVLRALGGMGIALYDHTRQTVVDGNAILEVSGIGITVDGEGFVGTWRILPEPELPFPRAGQPRSSGDRITNNRIQRFGLDLWSSGGIVAAYPWEMAVEHNEVSEGYGPGVALGWYGNFGRCHDFPGYKALKRCQSSSGRNRIVGNRIFAVGGIINDVGGIYTLSHQSPSDTFEDGLTISGNHVSGMKRLTATFPTVVAALYLDGDTSYTTVTENIFEKPVAHSTVEGAFGMYGETASIFLNPDDKTSVPPHNIRWNAQGAFQLPGDNVTEPGLKPHVRDAAGLLPAYRDVPSVKR